MSTRFLVVLGLVAAVPRVSAQSTLTYEPALAMARDRAPRVAVARARIDEARGRLIGAGIRFRDNPVLDLSSGPRKLETGIVTDYDVGISQVFELGRRRAARIEAAQAGVSRETSLSEAAVRQVVREVAVAFIRALSVQVRLDALRSAESLARDAFTVAEQRYRAGDIAVLDVNVSRAALARATAQIRAADADLLGAIGERTTAAVT